MTCTGMRNIAHMKGIHFCLSARAFGRAAIKSHAINLTRYIYVHVYGGTSARVWACGNSIKLTRLMGQVSRDKSHELHLCTCVWRSARSILYLNDCMSLIIVMT